MNKFAFLIGEPGLEDTEERKYFLAVLDNQADPILIMPIT